MKFSKKTMIILAALLIFKSVPASASGIDKIDSMGNEILSYIQTGGRWVFSICGSIELIKSGIKRGAVKEEAPGILIKYGILYASLYGISLIFDYIQDVLG